MLIISWMLDKVVIYVSVANCLLLFFTLDVTVKRRVYVQRQLLSCVTQKAIHQLPIYGKQHPDAIHFCYTTGNYLSTVFYFTGISYAVVTQIMARVTALRSAPTHSVILVANVAIRPSQQSCAVAVYSPLLDLYFMVTQSSGNKIMELYANCPFTDQCYYSKCAYLSESNIKFLIQPVNNNDINLVLYVQHNKNTRIIICILSSKILFI